MTATIDSFKGRYSFLSNFYGISVPFEGVWYPSVEHGYQAAKTLDFMARNAFLTGTAREAKDRGRAIWPLRTDWEVAKFVVMLNLLRAKFRPTTLLAGDLEATGEARLVEGNNWGDTTWGVCDGKGANNLGRLLMQVRDENRTGKVRGA